MATANGSTRVTDAGLMHLKRLTELEELGLMKTRVIGAGLVHLKGLASLTTLSLHSTQITDAGLEHLKGLTNLRLLLLSRTQAIMSWYSSHEKNADGKRMTAIYVADLTTDL